MAEVLGNGWLFSPLNADGWIDGERVREMESGLCEARFSS